MSDLQIFALGMGLGALVMILAECLMVAVIAKLGRYLEETDNESQSDRSLMR